MKPAEVVISIINWHYDDAFLIYFFALLFADFVATTNQVKTASMFIKILILISLRFGL